MIQIIYGSYYEDYEIIHSIIVHGTYTNYAVLDYDYDIHFILLSLFSIINKSLPEIQIYGYVATLLNLSSIILFGAVLFDILKLKIRGGRFYALYSIILTALIADSIINLNSTRAVFIAMGALLHIFHYDENKDFKHNLKFYFAFFFLSLVRMDAVLLSGIVYLIINLFKRNISLIHFAPFVIGMFVFVSYNILLSNSDREAKKIFYYKEIDLVDRQNIDYENLKKLDSLYIDLMTNHLVFDEEYFNSEFIDNILKSGHGRLLNGISDLNNYFTTLKLSLQYYYLALPFILVVFVLIGILLFTKSISISNSGLIIFFILFPMLVCLFIITPLRFLIPYYACTIVLLLSFIKANTYQNKYFLVFWGLFFCFTIFSLHDKSNEYEKYYENYENYNEALDTLEEAYPDKTIVFESFYFPNHFPKPLEPLKRRNMVFFNFKFYVSMEAHLERWKDVCNCNPLSIKEKMVCIAKSRMPFISSEDALQVYLTYFKERYGITPAFSFKSHFFNHLNIYEVSFE